MRAALLTIGNEVVSGDVVNTNAAWLAQRLEALGVKVAVAASIPDEIEAVAEFVNRERPRVDHLIVTGGLGGTPDDLTREALAAAFGVAAGRGARARRRAAPPLPEAPGLRRALGAASRRVAGRCATRRAAPPGS